MTQTAVLDCAVGESQTLVEHCEQFEDEWFVTKAAILPYNPRDEQELTGLIELAFIGTGSLMTHEQHLSLCTSVRHASFPK